MPLDQVITREQAEILPGLKSNKKKINCKYFYDQRGSQLFNEITKLDEYYPTRTENKILNQYAKDIASYIDPGSVVIEPGAGSCQKIQHLLDAIKPTAYVPQDVSRDFLHHSANHLTGRFPWLNVHPIVSDFSDPIIIPNTLSSHTKYVFYPGSTIGNFDPDNAIVFLKSMRTLVGDTGGILLGVDLHKDSETLEAAYNDSKGITADFNLNILENINRVLEADLDPTTFQHKAFYDTDKRRIEMHLESKIDQSYQLLNEDITFKKGETIHTENSYKYSKDDISTLCSQANLSLEKCWVDESELFSLNFLKPNNA